jgi:hypothetical protein
MSREDPGSFNNFDKNNFKRLNNDGKRGMITVDEQDEFDNNSELQINIKVD